MRVTLRSKRVSLVWLEAMLHYAIHNSSQNPCETAGCQRWHIAQNASWRLGGGEARKTLGPSQTGRTRSLKLSSMYCMEAKARIFVCIQGVNSEHHRRVSSEHHHRYLINQARVNVCCGRAGGNERRLLFFVRYVEPWPYRTPSLGMN